MKKLKDIELSVVGTVSAVVRVFRLIWPEHRKVVMGFFAVSLFVSLLPFVQSGASALFINEVLKHRDHGFTMKVVGFVALYLAAMYLYDIFTALRTRINKHLWIGLTEFFELAIVKKRSELDVATLEDPKTNDLLNKATEKGVWPICNLIEGQFEQATNMVQMVAAAVVFFLFDWRLSVIAALAAVPDFVVELKYGKSSWDIWDSDSQTRRKFASLRWHFLRLENLTELKIFQNTMKFYQLMAGLLKGFNDKQRLVDVRTFWWRVVAKTISSILQALVYVMIIGAVLKGYWAIGTMTFLMSSLTKFQGGLTGFFHNLAFQFEWGRYANDMFKVFDIEPVICSPKEAARVSPDVAPSIEFRHVSFCYPGTERLILRDINFSIAPGERLAIVGLNGAGKSTLIKLLMRFYDPTGGEILVNGMDLRNLDRNSWWSVIAALFQDFAKYDLPVREVISLGRSDGAGYLSRAVRSAKAVDAHDFIVGFPKRYEQMLGKEFDEGIDLSVGQSQKMALARSIYREPRLMILDEPTASIDASAEAKIFERLEEDISGRTQIVISHRFSTVRRSDRICVLEDGTVSELGTHEELIANDRTYAHLFRLQAKGYE